MKLHSLVSVAVSAGLLTIALNGCAGSRAEATHPRANGLIITHDGRMVADTADIAREELIYILQKRSREAAGPDWKSTVAIAELPQFEIVRPEEWGWKTITISLTLVPPANATQIDEGRARAIEAASKLVEFRVRNRADIGLATTVLAAGVAAPGSSRYTVVTGDTLAGISTAFYGTSQHWRMIADANPGVEIIAGAELSIPPKP
jgi:nucleoid-associated protein YgaU